ncbi:MAG: integrase core domain-containing protein [bacterium]
MRRNSFLSIEDARNIIDRFIEYYNNKRLHSAIDYVAPLDILLGKKEEILKSRDEKLRKARELRVKYYNQKTCPDDRSGFHLISRCQSVKFSLDQDNTN